MQGGQDIVRPDGKEVSFAYDALGRRIRKSFAGTTTHFVWDGNVPLYEWTEENEMITWLFEQDTFVPTAKLVANGECFSVISDYLGTPLQAYDKRGNKVWEQELDIYGRKRTGNNKSSFIPFKYQGQYEDIETGLYYNRFRYSDSCTGNYISQDPIGLSGGDNLYSYVQNPTICIDTFGLSGQRWMGKTKKDGTPYKKPGPKPKGTGAHNAKIEEIINREASKPDITHIGGGSKTEITINTPNGSKPYRRMDTSFQRADGSIYHINVGRTLNDDKTGIKRERLALEDALNDGHDVSFEGYGRDSEFRKKQKIDTH